MSTGDPHVGAVATLCVVAQPGIYLDVLPYGMDKQTVVPPDDGILFSAKET